MYQKGLEKFCLFTGKNSDFNLVPLIYLTTGGKKKNTEPLVHGLPRWTT